MTTPLCPAHFHAGDASCLGSRCIKWVPETQREGVGPATLTPTGRGNCIDNMRVPAFADPATPTDK